MANEYLEKLIFEVYGAEEAADKIEKLREQEEKHAKSLKGLKKQARETAREQKKAAEETARTSKIAGAALLALGKMALDASADLETAQGRVERSAKKQRVTMGELEKALEGADKRSRRLGIGQVETREYMSDLIDVTGKATKSAELYALAVDIAATGDVELREAVELLTRAYKGEVEELKKLDGISKQQAEILAGIANESDRARVAVSMLTKEYSGAADELKDTNTAMQNLKEAGSDWLAVLGDAGSGLINYTAEFLKIVKPGQSLLNQFAGGLRNAADDARQLGNAFQALVRWRREGGLGMSDKSILEHLSDIETEQAQARADEESRTWTGETGTGYKIKRGGGRGGYGGGRGGYRDVPREEPAKKRGSGRTDDEGPGFITLEEAEMFADGEFTQQSELQDAYARQQEAMTEILRSESEKRIELHNEEVQRTIEARAYLDDLEKKTAEIQGESTEKKKQATAETEDYVNASLAAAGQLTNAFIKDEGAKAVILGGIEVGKALSAAFTNPPAAITHGAAAAQFFAVAAQAGMSGGKKSKMGAGKAAAPNMLAQDRERLGRVGDDKPAERQSETVVININSAITPHPEQVRKFADELDREYRNQTGRQFGPQGGGR